MALPEMDPRARALAMLKTSRIFGALDAASLSALTGAGHVVALEPGTVLFQKGDQGDAAFIVIEGELEVRTISAEGRELRIAAHPAGGLIGEMATLDGAPRSADVVAARRCTLWRLPRTAVLDTLKASPEAAIALLVELTGRLRTANAQLELTARRDLESQLAALLVAEKNRQGRVAMTQTEMARRIGFSREKVNRKLHAWAQAGWLAVEREGVLIRRSESLEDLAP